MTVRDDGAGGADPRRGTGLRGLNDRVAALDGRFEVTSPARRGHDGRRRAARWRPVRRALALLAVLGAVALTGCDSGPPVSQTRDLGGFNRLEVSGDLSLDIRLLQPPRPGCADHGRHEGDRPHQDRGRRRRAARLDQVARPDDRSRPARRRLDQPRRAGAAGAARRRSRPTSTSAACRRRPSSCASTAPATSGPAAASTTSRWRSTAPPTPTSRTSRRRTPASASTAPATSDLRVARSLELIVEGSRRRHLPRPPVRELAPRGLGQRHPAG